MKKRIISMLLVLTMVLAVLPQLALQARAENGGFVIENGVLTKYDGPGGAVVIPDGVTAIGKNAFSFCDSMTSVTIPDSVKSIGASAFSFCTALQNVKLPAGLTRIREFTFTSCTSLTSVTIPDSVSKIDEGAFLRCTDLAGITISDNVTSIEQAAFEQTAFYDDASNWSGDLLYLGRWLIGAKESVTAADIAPGTKGIAGNAFHSCGKLKTASIPDSVAYIGPWAFYGCSSLTDVTIPDGVTGIGAWTFCNCTSLTDVTIPDSVKTIGAYSFCSCTGLTSVTISDGVDRICEFAFSDCGRLSEVTILNPYCVIDVHNDAIYHADDWLPDIVDTFEKNTVVIGYKDSTSENYADTWGHTFKAIDGEPERGMDFADVPIQAFYTIPVLWAAEHEITNGFDDTHFGPEKACTRGQVLTFLWRAAGCPEPKSTQTAFTDVAPDAFYGKAVAWAVEQGITKGVTETDFFPDWVCTREQIVTFLWRFMQSPEPLGGIVLFQDLKAGAYYEKAVAWAVEEGVTNGLSVDSFGPSGTCTRGQVVTFLYRAAEV